jgi:hypothetical protein
MSDVVLGAKQYSSPKNIKPQLDTDAVPYKTHDDKTRMDISNADAANPPHMDTNPEEGKGLFSEHPLKKALERPKHVRHQLGHFVPRRGQYMVSEN